MRAGLDGNPVNAGDLSAYPRPSGGGRTLKAKTLKKMLKKAGLKCSGKKATLRARAKKAHLVSGGGAVGAVLIGNAEVAGPVGGRRRSRRHRSRGLFRKFF